MADPYADVSHFAVWGLPRPLIEAAELKSPGCVASGLSASSRVADSYFRNRYTLPLLSWDDAIRQRVCEHAAASVLGILGVNPEGPDKFYFDRAKDAEKWFADVGASKASPDVADSTPEVNEGGAWVVTSPRRNW